jgi:hypothetical protein
MANIFISHSKRDEATVAAFCNVFARTQHGAFLAEFEAYAVPPWTQIKNWVQQSSALFVLLSPHLQTTPYTQNWVSYEVGLACALNKPVWVYEHWNNPVAFPIPYLTDYVMYNPASQEDLNAIRQLVEVYDQGPTLVLAGLGALLGAALSGGLGAGVGAVVGGAIGQRRPPGTPVRCPQVHCGITFRIYNRLQGLYCPACRGVMYVRWPDAT